jgi:hypothetical protein
MIDKGDAFFLFVEGIMEFQGRLEAVWPDKLGSSKKELRSGLPARW